jgi:hypothetical protein
MAKRNKVRYQSAPVKRIEVLLSGRSWLQFEDEDITPQAKVGDVVFYAHYSGQSAPADGDYRETGYVGYLKLDVWEGKKWCPVLVQDVFSKGEHHFSKKERAYDTYILCRGLIEALKGRILLRTYREHYTLDTSPLE